MSDGVILHRDIKPENVLLRREAGTGEAVAALGDFGISKLYPAMAAVGHATTHNLLGTPGYDCAQVTIVGGSKYGVACVACVGCDACVVLRVLLGAETLWCPSLLLPGLRCA